MPHIFMSGTSPTASKLVPDDYLNRQTFHSPLALRALKLYLTPTKHSSVFLEDRFSI